MAETSSNVFAHKDYILSHTHKSHSPESVIEIETRFHGINYRIFTRIFTALSQRDDLTHTDEVSIDLIIGGVRYSATEYDPPRDGFKYGVRAITKTQLYAFDDPNYDLKTAVSLETPTTATGHHELKSLETQAEMIRHKDRRSFTLGQIRIDMTKVVSKKQKQTPQTNYEIEAEIIGEITDGSILVLNGTVDALIKMVRGDGLLYTTPERNEVCRAFNTILGVRAQPFTRGAETLSHGVISQARNLKSPDCVYGQLVGGPFRYSMTVKAHGDRKQLIIHSTGVWLVYPPDNFELVFRFTRIGPDIQRVFGTIIDGENLLAHARIDTEIRARNLFTPFDCMAVGGSREIQSRDLFERQRIALEILGFLPTSSTSIRIQAKEFLEITLENVFTVTRQLTSKSLPFKTDGFLITPINSPYLVDTVTVPLHERQLAKQPDICKLKPWEELTIDFLYVLTSSGEKNGTLMINRREGGAETKQVPFTGSRRFPFDPITQVDWTHPMFETFPSGVIIEMGPYHTETSEIRLRPVLIRENKTQPNRDEIARAVWDDINRPLRLETFEGRTFDLLFQYHNTEKRTILEQIAPDSDVVDIGIGRGGDLGKYRNLHHLLGVEPSAENAEELKRRVLANPHFNSKFTLVETGGQDTATIVSAAASAFGWKAGTRRKLYIVMMLSLSFFFGPDDLYAGLVQTITELKNQAYAAGCPEVTFMCMTISGQQVIKAFEANKSSSRFVPQPPQEGGSRRDLSGVLTLGDVTMEYDGDKTIEIHIPNSIVTHQTEYLVDLGKLVKDLKIRGASRSTICDKEKMLNPNEQIFTRMFIKYSEILPQTSSKTKYVKIKDAYVGIPNSSLSNSFWEACITALSVKLTPKQLRQEYLKYLMTPRTDVTPEQVAGLYGGVNPAEGTPYPPTAMFFCDRRYCDKIATYGGLPILIAGLESTSQLSYEILDLVPQMLGHNIAIYSQDLSSQVIMQFHESAKTIGLVLTSNGLYMTLGLISGDKVETIF